jgi:hypothetical protein
MAVPNARKQRQRPRAISREEMSGCGCTRSIVEDPPLFGEFAVPRESKKEFEEEVERSEKKRKEQAERGDVGPQPWRWIRRKRSVGTQKTDGAHQVQRRTSEERRPVPEGRGRQVHFPLRRESGLID